jgi:hypothetical protein
VAADLSRAFLASDDTLRIYRGDRLVFSSKKDRLLPLMDYIGTRKNGRSHVIIYDKVMGNAAALLSVIAEASSVFSPLGSGPAVKTLEKHGIQYRLQNIVPFILRDDGKGLCPMEQLSLGKSPGEFYTIMKDRIIHAGV